MFKVTQLLKYVNQSYSSSVLHIVLWCFTFQKSLLKISQIVIELQSRQENFLKRFLPALQLKNNLR